MVRSASILLLLLAACALRPAAPVAAPVEVSVTVDDLPLHGALIDGWTRVELAQRMVKTFQAHGLPPIYGFVNAGKVEAEPSSRAVLDAWKAGGQRFGNHSYAHRNLDETPLEDYLADIARNEALLSQLESPAVWHVYRYPYLHEGKELEKRRAVRTYLKAHGYRIAEVSIDADDWAFSSPLARCAAQQNTAQLEKLRAEFVAVHVDELRRMRALGRTLEGREIRQVLLLHLGVADVDALDELLTAYEREGVKWVSLDRALDDPFYAVDPDIGFKAGAAFPYVVARARGVKVEPPIYARGLEERLEATCRETTK